MAWKALATIPPNCSPAVPPGTTTNAEVFDCTKSYLGATEWNGAITYGDGDRVAYLYNIYVSIQGTNFGNQPNNNPTWWVFEGTQGVISLVKSKCIKP